MTKPDAPTPLAAELRRYAAYQSTGNGSFRALLVSAADAIESQMEVFKAEITEAFARGQGWQRQDNLDVAGRYFTPQGYAAFRISALSYKASKP